MILFSLLVTGLSVVSANTVVSGKIYNSDFSEVIEGADVSVDCNSKILDTESLSDGAYAVVFDSEDCPLGSEVKVDASKGTMSDSDDTTIEESEEEAGELVGVVNLNIKEKTSSSSSGTRKTGTWFKCGNTVCESGETYQTCAKDCPKPVEQTVTNTDSNSNPETEEKQEPEVTITTTSETSDSPITGAVIGTGSKNKNTLPISLAGIILLLIVGISGIAVAKNEKNNKSPPKMDEGGSMYKPLSGFF